MKAAATNCWPVPTPAVATEIEPVDQRHRNEILQRIVTQFGIQRRIERHVGEPAHHKRITIRLALARGLRAHHRAGAGLVLDHEGLSHAFGKHVGEMPPDQIVAAARTDRDDDFYRAVGIGLRAGTSGNDEEHKSNRPCQRAAKPVHCISPKAIGHQQALFSRLCDRRQPAATHRAASRHHLGGYGNLPQGDLACGRQQLTSGH